MNGLETRGADAIEARAVELDALDRMVLTADGTVTTLLEAGTGEPIVTRTIRQSGPATLDRLRAVSGCWWQPDVSLLGLAPGDRLMARQVTLTGALTGVVYVLAESLVVPDRLPEWFAGSLAQTGSSLGRLLAAGRLETRREIQQIDTERAGEAADHLDIWPSATLVRRSYTILIGQRAVAAVTEWLVPGRLAATARTIGSGAVDRQTPLFAGEELPRIRVGPEFVADL
jgi:chorismate-pyruvate lyase